VAHSELGEKMIMMTLRLFDGYDHTSPELRPTVARLQAILRAKLNDMDIDIDGYFGPGTEEAVINFQKQFRGRLKPDGIVGDRTWAMLNDEALPTGRYATSYHPEDRSLSEQDKIARKYSNVVDECARNACVLSSVIVGLISRESHWGLLLRPPGPTGTGDFTPRKGSTKPPKGEGYGRGLCQIDFNSHEFARTGNWRNPNENILYCGTVLRQNQGQVNAKFGTLGPDQILRATLASYNCGFGRVKEALSSGKDIDYFTAHRDYSADVLSRAGWFQSKGWL